MEDRQRPGPQLRKWGFQLSESDPIEVGPRIGSGMSSCVEGVVPGVAMLWERLGHRGSDLVSGQTHARFGADGLTGRWQARGGVGPR